MKYGAASMAAGQSEPAEPIMAQTESSGVAGAWRGGVREWGVPLPDQDQILRGTKSVADLATNLRIHQAAHAARRWTNRRWRLPIRRCLGNSRVQARGHGVEPYLHASAAHVGPDSMLSRQSRS